MHQLKNFKILDIGGGLSFLHLYFSQFSKVVNVELLGFGKTWFPTDNDGLYTEITDEFRESICFENIEYVEGDFFNFAAQVDSNEFDLIIDGCSIIHFNMKLLSNKEKAIQRVGKEIQRLLKPNGFFLSSTHCAHPASFEYRDMVYLNTIINGYTEAGLVSKYKAKDLVIPKELANQKDATNIARMSSSAPYKNNRYIEILDPCKCCENHGFKVLDQISG